MFSWFRRRPERGGEEQSGSETPYREANIRRSTENGYPAHRYR